MFLVNEIDSETQQIEPDKRVLVVGQLIMSQDTQFWVHSRLSDAGRFSEISS